jgi:hypothetical protein
MADTLAIGLNISDDDTIVSISPLSSLGHIDDIAEYY